MTHEMSLALVEAMVTSPKVKAHLGAVLGFKKVPGPADFEATNAEDAENCERFLDYMQDAVGVLRVIHSTRPKQRKIQFDSPEGAENNGAEAPKKKRRGRKAKV